MSGIEYSLKLLMFAFFFRPIKANKNHIFVYSTCVVYAALAALPPTARIQHGGTPAKLCLCDGSRESQIDFRLGFGVQLSSLAYCKGMKGSPK